MDAGRPLVPPTQDGSRQDAGCPCTAPRPGGPPQPGPIPRPNRETAAGRMPASSGASGSRRLSRRTRRPPRDTVGIGKRSRLSLNHDDDEPLRGASPRAAAPRRVGSVGGDRRVARCHGHVCRLRTLAARAAGGPLLAAPERDGVAARGGIVELGARPADLRAAERRARFAPSSAPLAWPLPRSVSRRSDRRDRSRHSCPSSSSARSAWACTTRSAPRRWARSAIGCRGRNGRRASARFSWRGMAGGILGAFMAPRLAARPDGFDWLRLLMIPGLFIAAALHLSIRRVPHPGRSRRTPTR